MKTLAVHTDGSGFLLCTAMASLMILIGSGTLRNTPLRRRVPSFWPMPKTLTKLVDRGLRGQGK